MSRPPSPAFLAIYATKFGIGFVLFESPTRIINWGLKDRWSKRTPVAAMQSVIDDYGPDTLVLPTWNEQPVVKWIRKAYRVIEGVATSRGLTIKRIERQSVDEAFRSWFDAETQHARAVAIGRLLRCLATQVPPERRSWFGQHRRSSMFEAASLGLTAYAELGWSPSESSTPSKKKAS